jgi:hypothetical protein
MKKLIVRLFIAFCILILLAVLAVHFFLDSAIKKGFNTVGPKITKVDTRIDGASLAILSGAGKVKGLFIGNPEGYKSASAIQVGSSSFAVQPGSLLSDKVIVKSVRVESPELTFETDLKGNNLKKILSNIQETTGTSGTEPTKEPQPKEPAAKAGKKLEVDEFVITGTKLHVTVNAPVIGQRSATVPVPDINLPPLGKGNEGVTVAEVSSVALQALLDAAIKEAEKVVTDLVKGGQFMGKDVGTNTTGTIQKATKGLGDLLQKKQ